MLFDHCAVCQSCCNVDSGFGPLEITLTQKESSVFKHLCIEDQCEYLGEKGCKLGDDKPFSCKLYPLSFDPKTEAYYFDASCPLLPEYKKQLKNPDSDASRHLKSMDQLLMHFMSTDEKFLDRNHKVDLNFFELTPLKKPTFLKVKS